MVYRQYDYVVIPPESQPLTLGAVLYANDTQALVSESTWVGLVQSVAARDQRALHALYTRTSGVVFTWIMRTVGNWETAEDLTLDVFHDLWRGASGFVPGDRSVVGWIMDDARSRAIDRRRSERRTPWLPPVDAVVSSPADFLSRSTSRWELLARRIAAETGEAPFVPAPETQAGPEWEEVAPGISCKLLATDREQDRVSMLVWLAPGVPYPPHTHAGLEELYLLHGELMIEDRKLHPGDYNRAEPGTGDQFVWSGTGCMCVLLTSTRDVLRGPSSNDPVGTPAHFRAFFQSLRAEAYCLDCLSRMYDDPAPTVWRYLSENGILGRYAECANCGRLGETFRSP